MTHRERVQRLVVRGLTSKGKNLYKDGVKIVDLVEGLILLRTTLREIWKSDPVASGWTEKAYRDKQRDIAKFVDMWMDTGFGLIGGWKDGKPQHETVAFCGIICRLLSIAGLPGTMSVTIDVDGREGTLVVG